MQILSVNVAKPAAQIIDGRTVSTSIGKRPVLGGVQANELGLWGDGRAEPRKFGELHHAVCALASEHYQYWSDALGGPRLDYGCFGENLTVRGALEPSVRIGDVWRVGSAVLQVAQPRIPCKKWRHQLGLHSSRPLVDSRKVGFYLRVREAGELWAGAGVEVLETDPASPSIDAFFRLTQIDYWDGTGLSQLLRARDLMPAWRTLILDKLERAEQADGWIGFRPLSLRDRFRDPARAGQVCVRLACPFGRALAPFRPGQYLTCALRRAEKGPLLQQAFALVGDLQDAQGYTLLVPEHPESADLVALALARGLAPGDEVRAAAPRGD